MEQLRDAKFNPQGKLKVVEGSIINTNTSSLALVLAAMGQDGKVDSKTYTVLSKKWSKAKSEARGWYQEQFDFRPSNIRATACQSDVWVVNMHCLDKNGQVDEKALAGCMKKVLAEAKSQRASVHISSVLLEQVPQLEGFLPSLTDNSVSVYLYREPEATTVS